MTETEAKRGAKAMHKKHHKQFEAYLCSFCGFHHIGGREPKALRLRELPVL